MTTMRMTVVVTPVRTINGWKVKWTRGPGLDRRKKINRSDPGDTGSPQGIWRRTPTELERPDKKKRRPGLVLKTEKSRMMVSPSSFVQIIYSWSRLDLIWRHEGKHKGGGRSRTDWSLVFLRGPVNTFWPGNSLCLGHQSVSLPIPSPSHVLSPKRIQDNKKDTQLREIHRINIGLL